MKSQLENFERYFPFRNIRRNESKTKYGTKINYTPEILENRNKINYMTEENQMIKN